MDRKRNFTGSVWTLLFVAVVACSNNSHKEDGAGGGAVAETRVEAPAFNADSAYLYVSEQTAFGPRVPNTEAHGACGDYIAGRLQAFGAVVYNQYADLVAYDNTLLKARNIIGAFNPESKKRVLLCAHWDSRPYADQDKDKTRHRNPILGANDGASGVGVLLEVARLLQEQAPAVGIDIAFFDAEDYGSPYFYTGPYKADTWCLGSQYWGRVPHVEGYTARFGILLDMVGGKGGTFYQERFSKQTAGSEVKKIWGAARRLGYGGWFRQSEGSEITDDHVYVYRLRHIPCVDIINYCLDCESGFGDFWHTTDDNMDIIDKATLTAVGQTVLDVIYNEK
ncbi:MAG: M28 family peptidase [Prevotellaceae bacterium]|nr:M28 family peptidase [Prevotellaceae bacterium]